MVTLDSILADAVLLQRDAGVRCRPQLQKRTFLLHLQAAAYLNSNAGITSSTFGSRGHERVLTRYDTPVRFVACRGTPKWTSDPSISDYDLGDLGW